MSLIVKLSERQLAAYNANDLDAFCSCFHGEVVVLDGEVESLRGAEAFREAYGPLFATKSFGAEVPERLEAGAHCVDYETWWRVNPESGERSEGALLVRYTERDELIGVVQFLR